MQTFKCLYLKLLSAIDNRLRGQVCRSNRKWIIKKMKISHLQLVISNL